MFIGRARLRGFVCVWACACVCTRVAGGGVALFFFCQFPISVAAGLPDGAKNPCFIWDCRSTSYTSARVMIQKFSEWFYLSIVPDCLPA